MSRSTEAEWLFWAQMRADARLERKIRKIVEEIRAVERRYGALVGQRHELARTEGDAA